jgi:putative redox protein
MDSTVTLKDGMAFDVAIEDHHFTIDAHAEVGGQGLGPPPKALMLSALAGCASMDIVSILRKMASADLTTDHPRTFVGMTVLVTVTGDVPVSKLWKAVALSRDRYCGVAAMLKAHGPIHYIVELNGEEVAEPA